MKSTLLKKALILDHDDTVVASTETVHYPAFVRAVEIFRPHIEALSFSQFQHMNLNPGLEQYYTKVLMLSPEEKETEYRLWRRFADEIIPKPYPDIHEILLDFQQSGGLIFVSSLNHKNVIERDYRLLFPEVKLTDIYCADNHSNILKPNPLQLHTIMEQFHLNSHDLLMVDDLHYGLEMAQNAQVDFAYAKYSQVNENNHIYFQEYAQFILEQPSDLKKLLFNES